MKKFRDDVILGLIAKEEVRQSSFINLTASENIVSRDVRRASGSVLTNKYAEGYPGARYYAGCEIVDQIERIAISRACELFGCNFANVQPHSGSQANQAAYLALLNPGDKILSMSLDCGGHLTHGHKLTQTGAFFDIHHYGVDETSHEIDYEDVMRKALQCKPKLIIAGSSSYSLRINFEKMRQIADEVGAYLMCDIAHYSGLIAVGKYPSPFPHCHVATMTTHKTMRGPRGGMILTNDQDLAKKIDRAVFPGVQGGPCMQTVAAKAIAFAEAGTEEYREYISSVLSCAKSFANALHNEYGCSVVAGRTECHMFIIDLSNKDIDGRAAQNALMRAGIVCNKNTIPYDKRKPALGSGVRLGVAAAVSMGLEEQDFIELAKFIAAIFNSAKNNSCDEDIIAKCSDYVHQLLMLKNKFI